MAKRIPRYVEPQMVYIAANAAMILVRDGASALTFPVGFFFLLGEPRLVRGSRPTGGLSLLRNHQGLRDSLRESRFRCLAVAQLTAGLARNDTNRTVVTQPRRQSRQKSLSLFFGNCARRGNVPGNLDAR